MTVSPIHVTNWFIKKGIDSSTPLTHMQVQKFTYLTHGYWLQENDTPIFNEDPEVWPYGPVFDSVWGVLRTYRKAPIDDITSNVDMIRGEDRDPKILLVERVWKKYGNLDGGKLSDLTHKVGSPWHTLASQYNFRAPKHLKIPVDLIKEHYRKVVEPLS